MATELPNGDGDGIPDGYRPLPNEYGDVLIPPGSNDKHTDDMELRRFTNMRFTCRFCRNSFSNHEAWSRHFEELTQCKNCKNWYSHHAIRHHYSSCFRCNKCNERYDNLMDLQIHPCYSAMRHEDDTDLWSVPVGEVALQGDQVEIPDLFKPRK